LYGVAKTEIQRLQTVMNAAAQLVGGLGRYDHVKPVLQDMLHCLPIRQRIYTVNHKKGGRTFVIITLENLDGFL